MYVRGGGGGVSMILPLPLPAFYPFGHLNPKLVCCGGVTLRHHGVWFVGEGVSGDCGGWVGPVRGRLVVDVCLCCCCFCLGTREGRGFFSRFLLFLEAKDILYEREFVYMYRVQKKEREIIVWRVIPPKICGGSEVRSEK